ncbi:MAG: alanine racemase [bacterium]|nr:alanine racemase [bacterium]
MVDVLYRTWCEVDTIAITNNIKQIQSKIGRKRKLIAVIKADAYGHGAVKVAQIAQKLNVPYLGLATYDESILLREAGITIPIIVLSCCQTAEVDPVINYELIPNICHYDVAVKLNQLAAKHNRVIPFHTEIDTGIGRIGVYYSEATKLIKRLVNLTNLKLTGLFTHFACADTDPEFTALQVQRYKTVINELATIGISVPFQHVANSATVLAYPKYYFDGVRPGLIIYGLYPAISMQRLATLQEAMTLKSRIIYIKRCKAGRTISYGKTYITNKPTIIATISAGYRNGYPRLLSNRGEVLVHGKRVPIVGRICMDQFMTDISAVPQAQVGDEVVLFGKQKRNCIRIDEVAEWASTISYEIVCSVGRLNKRIYM